MECVTVIIWVKLWGEVSKDEDTFLKAEVGVGMSTVCKCTFWISPHGLGVCGRILSALDH